ncbi:MAG: glycosyltransferase family 2 protein [Bacteroidota bacterium]
MQSKELISVVIPTYNRANDLIVAINSVLKQSYPVLEILVCDDGSSDRSKELVHALKNPIVQWIDCGKNGGPAIPRNIGIKRSKGNWIAFLDSDDEWHFDKIEKQINAIKAHGVKACSTNASRIRFGENKGPYLQYNTQFIKLKDLMSVNSIICSSVLVERKLLADISLFPEDKKFIAEDYVLWLRLSTSTDFVFINECLINYTDNVEVSYRSESTHKDEWEMFDVIFSDFREWLSQHKIRLGGEEKIEFKKIMKRIKQKGIPTYLDEFFRKLSNKLKIKTRYNS